MTRSLTDWPDVWGAGQILAFSGIDGPVDFNHQLVLHTGDRVGGLDVRLPIAASLTLEGAQGSEVRCLLGDVIIAADGQGGEWRAAFTGGQCLAGELPPGGSLTSGGRPVGEQPTCLAENEKVQLWAVARGGRWALCSASRAGNGGNDGHAVLEEALRTDLAAVVEERMRFVAGVTIPAETPAPLRKLIRKAVSVQKVNVMPPFDKIERMWTTPDRWPHLHLWLWDSGFQSVGLSHVDPKLAQQTLFAILDQVQENGFLPHTLRPDGTASTITQPPILAWAVERVAEVGGQDAAAFIEACVDPLWRYLEWDRQNRDVNGNGLLEWDIEGERLCRSGESGADNSPRFDSAVELDAPDFSAFLAHDYECLGRLFERLGREDRAAACFDRSKAIGEAINALLWCEESGFYMDRDLEGRFTGIKAVSGFVPLWAGVATPERAERLVQHLENPATFGSAFPIPSVSLDSGVFTKDMWRGPSWINMNWLIIEGLGRYGFHDQARRLREQTLDTVGRWYERDGSVFEFYDALDLTSPRDLDRKQRLALGKGMAPISDYHWTASTVVALTLGASNGGRPHGHAARGHAMSRG